LTSHADNAIIGIKRGTMEIFMAGKIVNDNVRVRWPQRIIGTSHISIYDLSKTKNNVNACEK
jgi:hypothetical protein